MMLTTIDLDLARERQERFIAEAAQRRLVVPRPSTLRLSLGRRVIGRGAGIAGDPFSPRARSRCGAAPAPPNPEETSGDHRRP
jgi:hypothetical protein